MEGDISIVERVDAIRPESIRYTGEMEVRHFRNGQPLLIWQENALGRFLIKHGIIGPHFPKVRFLLGSWGFTKVLKV